MVTFPFTRGPLVVVLAVLAAVLVPTALPTSASAAASLSSYADGDCGRGATIVGTPGATLTGTEGDDVVFTNGAAKVDTLGGDDLVCVKSTTGHTSVVVNTGAGDDVVRASDEGAGGRHIVADLGSGDDTLDQDWCNATAEPEVDAGPGTDQVHLVCDRDGYDTAVDLRAGTISVSGEVYGQISGFEDVSLEIFDAQVIGDDGPNQIRVSGCGGLVRAGGGDDVVEMRDYFEFPCFDSLRPGTVFGGSGDDVLEVDTKIPTRMRGDAGYDIAVGRSLDDTCQAEQTSRCRADGHAPGAPGPVEATTPGTPHGQTCQGRPATLVGEPHATLVGTPGSDVIVSNGAVRVQAGSGDDLICTTGGAGFLVVDAGPDADVVDRSADYGTSVTLLGEGTDQYTGTHAGNGTDVVFTDGDGDHVRAGASDVVASGIDGAPNTDKVRVGLGQVEVRGDPQAPASFTGRRRGTFALVGASTSGTWTLDLDRHELRAPDEGPARVAGLAFNEVDAAGREVSVRGTSGHDDVRLASPATANLRAGNDDLDLLLGCSPGARARTVDGGPGTDTVGATSCTRAIRLDLDGVVRGSLRTSGPATAKLRGWESGGATARHVRLFGTPRADELIAAGCDVVIAGDAGDDRLGGLPSDDPDQEALQCPRPSRVKITGGPGNDRLFGTGLQLARMIGGSGRDKAYGDRGDGYTDTCAAERRHDCRRP